MVSGLSGKFLDCPDSFGVVRTVSALSRQFWYGYELKGAIFTLLQKLSGFLQKRSGFLQKLSGQQCWHADEVFVTLDSSVCLVWLQLFMLWRLQGTYLAQVALFGSNGSCLAPNPVRRFAHFIFACFRMDCNCFKSHKGTFIKSFSWSTFHDTFHQQLLWVDLIISVGVLGPVTMEPEFSRFILFLRSPTGAPAAVVQQQQKTFFWTLCRHVGKYSPQKML